MKSIFFKPIRDSIKYWYVPLIIGLFFIVVSVIAFTSPERSLLTLSILFALSFLLSGISEVVFSLMNRNRMENWGWSLAFGIITLILGISLLMHPNLSLGILAFYIGIVILFRSVAAFSFALDLKRYGSKKWGSLLALGIIGAIFSFILILNPVFTGMSIVVLVALSFLFAGLFSISLSLQLRKIHKSSKSISSELKKRYDDIMEILDELDD